MDRSKLTILILIVLAIFVGIYYFTHNMQINKPSKVTLVITMLENRDLKNSIEEITNKVSEYISKLEPNELEIKLNNSSIKQVKNNTIIKKPNQNEIKWKDEIKNLIRTNLLSFDKIELSNSSTNELIYHTIKNFGERIDDEETINIITGAFPDCYDKGSSVQLQNKISKMKVKQDVTNKLIWSVLDSRNNEEAVLNSIQKNRLAVVTDSRVIIPHSRICEETKRVNVYAAFFDSLNDEQATEFLKYLKLTYGNSVKLKIWNDSELNNRILNLNLKDSISKNDIEALKQIKKCNWVAIGALFIPAVNEFKQLPISEEKNFIIVGNMPAYGKGYQLDSNVWNSLKNDSLAKITIYLPAGNIPSQMYKDIKQGFTNLGIKYQLIEN